MGDPTVPLDIWTFHHFLSGLISALIVYPEKKHLSFWLSVLTHFFIDSSERTYCPDGKKINSVTNHFIDNVAFIIGWFLGSRFKISNNNNFFKILMTIYLILVGLNEILIERFPYNKRILLTDGVFAPPDLNRKNNRYISSRKKMFIN